MDEATAELRCVVGDGPSEATLRALLARTGGDVAAAANAFFDGSVAEQMASEPSSGGGGGGSRGGGGDDVLATLFKTLEDVGRKLAGAAALQLTRPLPQIRGSLDPWGRISQT